MYKERSFIKKKNDMDAFPRYSKSKYSRGQIQVLRERFQIPPDKPLPEDEKVVQMSSILNFLLDKIKNSDAVKASHLAKKWEEVIGEIFAHKTRPAYIAKNTLIIFVSDTAWLHEIRLCLDKNKLLEKIRAIDGCRKITSLKFELDPDTHGKK